MNSIVSGLPVQMNADMPTPHSRKTLVFDPETGEATPTEVFVLERPGPWYFPPLASAVQAAARLMLYTAIGAFEASGAVVADWDTDAVFVVATPTGGLIRFPGGKERIGTFRQAVRRSRLLRPTASRCTWSRSSRSRQSFRRGTGQPFRTSGRRSGCPGFFDPNRRTVRDRVGSQASFSRSPCLQEVRAASRFLPGGAVALSDVERMRSDESLPVEVEIVRASAHGLPYLAPPDSPTGSIGVLPTCFGARWAARKQPSRTGGGSRRSGSFRPLGQRQSSCIRKPGHFARSPFGTRPSSVRPVAPWHEGFDPATADWRVEDRSVDGYSEGVPIGRLLGGALLRAWYSFAPAFDPLGRHKDCPSSPRGSDADPDSKALS